jgi:hypothetical protein
MQLNDFQKSKVRFHLGYNAGAQVPAGDRSRLEEAMALVPDSYFYDQIVYQIARCERAWVNSEYFPTGPDGSPNYSRLEQIAGDVQRTIATSDPLKGDADFYEIYLRECDRLAETLYVANYKRPEIRSYGFERSGAEFIMAIPGPADTAVGTRVMLNYSWR